MNIQVQCCGVAILFLIMSFYFSNRKIGLYTETVFCRVFLGATVCILLDISSVITICCHNSIKESVVILVAKLYLVSLVWMGQWGLSYLLTDILTESKYKLTQLFLVILTLIESVLVLTTKIQYYFDGHILYTYDTSVVLTYVFTCSYILVTIFLLFAKGKMMNQTRRIAIAIWMLVWLVAALIQFIHPSWLLVGFAGVMGVLVLYVMLENPETQLDRRYGCFNTHAVMQYVMQFIERDEPIYAVDIFIDIKTRGYDSEIEKEQLLRQCVLYLKKKRNLKVFRSIDKELLIFANDNDELTELINDIKDKVDYYQHLQKTVYGSFVPCMYVIIIDDQYKLTSVEELFRLVQSMKEKWGCKSEFEIANIDSNITKQLIHEKEVKNEIQLALEENRVEVFLQPIYSFEQRRFVSAEGLCRIRKNENGYLSPGEFIPVAETSDLICELGERVFERTCKFIHDNDMDELGLNYIEVNLSVVQCEDRKLADKYIDIMKWYSVNPKYINLEITETGSIQAKENLLSNMQKLISYGVKFSLDDFGKGESNLMYLVDMPVSIVKLDMDMTKAYFENNKAKDVLETVVDMAHKLDISVVAEGVECKEELEGMKTENVDYIQGYYFSKPLPMNEFLKFIKNSDAANWSIE